MGSSDSHSRLGRAHWARNLLCGALIGVGAILPGVSGGVLAVVFDIYQPFMELLTRPKAALPRYWRGMVPIGIGWALGFLVLARGLSTAFLLSQTVTTWLFIGLIAGTVPSLFHEAGKQGRRASSWVSLVLCAGAVFAGLYYLSRVAGLRLEPGFWSFNLCGVLMGMGVVIPGMTSASVMMALGLYQPLLEGLSRMDLLVLTACLPGLGLTVLLLARFMSWFLREHYALAFHGILGIVLATTLVIVPTAYAGAGEAALSALCCAGGFLLATLLAKLDQGS